MWRRDRDDIKGWLIGVLLALVALVVLWFNERSAAIEVYDAAAAANVVHVDRVDAANEGKLVHVSGELVGEDLVDDLGVKAKGIRLSRTVTMYQWQERPAEQGAAPTYYKVWSPKVIDSSAFKQSAGHENPTALPLESNVVDAKSLAVADFTLPAEARAKLDLRLVPYEVDRALLAEHARSAAPGKETIGDVQISYRLVKAPLPISMVGKQVGASLEPFTVKGGDSIFAVALATKSAAELAPTSTPVSTSGRWNVRFVGLGLLALGLAIVMSPARHFMQILPPGHPLQSLGGALVGASMAAPMAALVVGIAWIRYRPMLALSLFIGVAIVLPIAVSLAKRARAKKMATPATS